MWKLVLNASILLSANLSAETKILAFSGSIREDSINKKLLVEAVGLARQAGAAVTLVDLRDYPLPFYDADLETKSGMPEKAKSLRRLMMQSQIIMIATPEYNGSLPALLKNFIDWASRGEQGGSSRDAFKGKKFVVMSASPGAGGGSRGLAHLRAIIENIGGTVCCQFIVPGAYQAFNEQGQMKDPKLKGELQQLVQRAIH